MNIRTANIYLEHFKRNLLTIRNLISPSVKMCIPVKAQAYGHGAVKIAKEALKNGSNSLAVATVEEGCELRSHSITCPILLLSITEKDEIVDLVENELTCFVHSVEYASLLADTALKLNKTAHVHIKIDTGMSRIGCSPSQAAALASFIHGCDALSLDGVSTHLSVSDSLNSEDIQFTKDQIKIFKDAISSIKALGIDPGLINCSNSGALFLHPDSWFDMIRPGIAVYGYYPNPDIAKYMKRMYPAFEGLKPVMELKSKIVQIKTIEQGCAVSYGRTWKSKEHTLIGTIPLGYADGLHRAYSPGIFVTIRDKKYPIVGRICMDQCMVNLGTDTSVCEGDEVVFFGPEANCLNADDYANVGKTISYEVLTSIGQRVKRNYIE